jgi:hypothetical protein
MDNFSGKNKKRTGLRPGLTANSIWVLRSGYADELIAIRIAL